MAPGPGHLLPRSWRNHWPVADLAAEVEPTGEEVPSFAAGFALAGEEAASKTGSGERNAGFFKPVANVFERVGFDVGFELGQPDLDALAAGGGESLMVIVGDEGVAKAEPPVAFDRLIVKTSGPSANES